MGFTSTDGAAPRLNIAIVGSGIAGMSAAWLLSHRHQVTLYEKAGRLGGHSNTVVVDTQAGPTPIDTGFIVYNEPTYPNLVALFEHLGVTTELSDMSFGVSLDGGAREYSSVGVRALFDDGRNLRHARFWSMIRDLLRFYREAPREIGVHRATALGDYLRARGYSDAFVDDHILPQAAAIWSSSVADIRDYPLGTFVRFFENHGLLQFRNRPQWRTVRGGARAYVDKLTAPFAAGIRLNAGVAAIRREGAGVWLRDIHGQTERFDHVVIAAHANDALAMLSDPDAQERALLGAFRYSRNRAVLHTDSRLMPRARRLWASWNYVGAAGDPQCGVTYWMNRLQNIDGGTQFFLSLNPRTAPREDTVLYNTEYEHPLFDAAALAAQEQLWCLQGVRNTWFCGAHFGAGFHEDGLQAGLAVAEQLGVMRRPWSVAEPSGRIHVRNPAIPQAAAA